MSKVFLFALTAALNPTLLAATTVMLLLPRPKRLLLGYLLGAYTTSITVGLAIIYWLKGSNVVSTTKHTISPIVDITLGVLALVTAVVVGTGRLARANDLSNGATLRCDAATQPRVQSPLQISFLPAQRSAPTRVKVSVSPLTSQR